MIQEDQLEFYSSVDGLELTGDDGMTCSKDPRLDSNSERYDWVVIV